MSTDQRADPLDDPLLRDVPEREGYKVLHPCVIYATLGRGGMGAVYLATHLNLHVDVAVKVLDPSLAQQDEQFVERFRREARAAARLNDRNVVRVYDVCSMPVQSERRSDGVVHYIIMEYVAGETARARVQRKGPLPLREAVQIALRAARGMAHAHAEGLIHRDIKPDNIMISTGGDVKVADLGLSKPMSGNTAMTQSRAVLGTPRYMPLEQWRNTKEVGPPSDVYGLGATLYFLLAGEDAIPSGDFFEILNYISTHPFPDVRAKRPDVPAALADVIACATAREPSARYHDAAAFADALAAAAPEGDTVLAHSGGDDAETVVVAPPPALTLASIQGAPLHDPRTAAAVAASAATSAPAAAPAPRGSRRFALAAVALVLSLAGLGTWRVLAAGAKRDDGPEPAPKGPNVALDLPADPSGAVHVRGTTCYLDGRVDGATSGELRLVREGRGGYLGAPIGPDGRFSFDLLLMDGERRSCTLSSVEHGELLRFELVHDDEPPVVTVLGPPADARTNAASFNVSIRVEDENLRDVPHLDDLAFTRGEDGTWLAGPVSLMDEGEKRCEVVATDWAGNETRVPVAVVRDVRAPALVSARPPAGTAVRPGETIDVELEFDEPVRGAWLGAQSLGAVAGSTARGRVVVPSGESTWEAPLVAEDAAGNRSAGEVLAYERDATPPVVRVVAPSARATRADSVVLEVALDEPHPASVRAGAVALERNDGGTWSGVVPLAGDGERAIEIVATDEAGNVGRATLKIVRDVRAPAFVTAVPGKDARLAQGSTAALALSFDEALAGATIAGEPAAIDGARATLETRVPDGDGAWRVAWTATDAAGNEGAGELVLDRLPKARVPPGWEIVDPTPGEGGWARQALDPSTGVTFVLVPSGRFAMGSPATEALTDAESPQHDVTIRSPFYIARTETTQAQWKRLFETNPSKRRGDALPVEQVSWNAARDYCRRAGYRLPTEAEWEYACRAGTRTPFATGFTLTTEQANYDGREPFGGAPVGVFRGATTAVASFAPNAWGLYDVHGNVWEWCADFYDERYYERSPDEDPVNERPSEFRVQRGGGWMGRAANCRSANRGLARPDYSFQNLGFRCVRELPR